MCLCAPPRPTFWHLPTPLNVDDDNDNNNNNNILMTQHIFIEGYTVLDKNHCLACRPGLLLFDHSHHKGTMNDNVLFN